MIDVTYKMPERNGTYILTVTGHAEYDEGFDAVCASMSTLIYTLAQNIKDASDFGWLRKNPTLKMEDGDARIKAKPDANHETIVAMMFTVIVRGIELVAANYPENITITKVIPDIVPNT